MTQKYYTLFELDALQNGCQRWSIVHNGPVVYLTCDAVVATQIVDLMNKEEGK